MTGSLGGEERAKDDAQWSGLEGFILPILFLDIFQKDLFGGIYGENFQAFLRTCFFHSTYFTLSKVIPPGYELVPNAAEAQLSQHLLKTISPKRWYGYGQICENMVQCVYHANDESLQILCSSYLDIFLVSRKKLKKVPVDTVGWKPKRVSTFENLCFFSNANMILGTVSHECICSTNSIDKDFSDELMKVGNWHVEKHLHLGIEQVLIPM